MNTVIDLTARAVSLIILKQDLYLWSDNTLASGNQKMFDIVRAADAERYFSKLSLPAENNPALETFKNRSTELVWISTDREIKAKSAAYAAHLSNELATWITDNRNDDFFNELKACTDIPTPYAWRTAISNILYKESEEKQESTQRTALSKALQYLPLQIILAIGGSERDAREQRLMQSWNAGEKADEKPCLNDDEIKFYNSSATATTPEDEIKKLLQSDSYLTRRLLTNKIPSPLSFELIFNGELDQVANSQVRREQEKCLPHTSDEKKEGSAESSKPDLSPARQNNPYARAKEMNLSALTISGGGIRSATFNLGILQGLAKHGILSRIDYLSTVSGGGYIGSWLAAWIKRKGSVIEVADRLNPDKSPDPFADETRPIRWLRMFSNYLNPDSGIMSVDSWTVGITFLRNTLINMIIILLLLLTLLFGGRALFVIWHMLASKEVQRIYWIWGILLLLVALLSGVGMRAYTRQFAEKEPSEQGKKKDDNHSSGGSGLSFIYYYISNGSVISSSIAFITILGSYLISSWFYVTSKSSGKFPLLWIPGGLNFLALMLTAALGRYDKCVISYHSGKRGNANTNSTIAWLKAWWTILAFTAVSVVIGMGALALVWQVIEWVHDYSFASDKACNCVDILYGTNEKLAFTISVPLLLLGFGVTIVTRMALLGIYFPDERREWWGRMGAIVNRNALLWLIIAGSALLGEQYLTGIIEAKTGIAMPLAAWAALVGTTVRTAFSSMTTGDGKTNSFTAKLTDFLGKFGPYLFILGLLFFVPVMLNPIEVLGMHVMNYLSHALGASYRVTIDEGGKRLLILAFLVAVLGICTYYLARRVGVNEFSMHHFYRNRLVRAYLGASRRNGERTKTENVFTHFDMKDDEKLSSFTFEKGYYGPYPILNTALNVSSNQSLDRQDRKAESFIFSPLYCGFDFSTTKAASSMYKKYYDYGYRPTDQYAYPDDNGPSIGTAMAISGAAVNPNMGYHSSPATAFLLTVFNVRLGWWMGNPRKSKWQESDPRDGLLYLMRDLAGTTNTESAYISLSDGGHFDNMGLYEMIRRKCRFIITGDGEQDEKFTCEGLANAIRRCLIDFGVGIDIDVSQIVKRNEQKISDCQYAVGTIHYPDDKEPGILLYIKSSMVMKEPVDVREYAIKNPEFPHQSTGDQFFTEDQFESYRKLGLYIVDTIMKDPKLFEGIKDRMPENNFIQMKTSDSAKEYMSAVNGVITKLKPLFPAVH